MDYQSVQKQAAGRLGPFCHACPECDGRACRNKMPGPGAKGIGDTAIRNYDMWKKIRLNMDTIHANHPIDPSLRLFGHTFRIPVFAGPVGAVRLHYGDLYDDVQYNDVLVSAAASCGILAFTGDGTDPKVVEAASEAIQRVKGMGIPTIKPWDKATIQKKIGLVEQADPVALAMDIDGAGLPFLQGSGAGSKSLGELKEIIGLTSRPFIVKGIMTPNAARKARDAGAAAIVVSNHGGRVLDQCPATAEVLTDIVAAVGHDIPVLVDGGIRSGADIFKALAMGASGVLIARPFVVAVYGAGEEGVQAYVHKLESELIDTMRMCGADTLADIRPDMIRLPHSF